MKHIGHSPIIVAHRGLHARHPENSLAAFAAAWRKGILWCECDVHLSADGVPVVIHDKTLDRMTTGRGPVAARTWEQLSRLRLLGRNGKPTDQGIPTLAAALRAPRGCRMMVETKPRLGRRILPIARMVLAKRGLLHSFHASDIELARRVLGPRLTCAVLADKVVKVDPSVGRLHVDYRALDKRTLQRLQASDVSVGVWTVNRSDQIRKLARWGVWEITTNRPLVARKIVQRL
jgi:glycerophosphoryl diester phosphodiesterase